MIVCRTYTTNKAVSAITMGTTLSSCPDNVVSGEAGGMFRNINLSYNICFCPIVQKGKLEIENRLEVVKIPQWS